MTFGVSMPPTVVPYQPRVKIARRANVSAAVTIAA